LIVRLGLDPPSEGVRMTLDRQIQIRRSRLSFLSDLMQRAGSRMGGSDLKRGANRYGERSAARSRSYGFGPPSARSNLTRTTPIERSGEKGRGVAVLLAGARSPRRRFAGDDRTWPSGLRLARDHAVEEAGGTGNPPVLSSWRVGARVGDPRGEGGSGRRTRRRARVPGSTAA
jgi:hypothetical protein